MFDRGMGHIVVVGYVVVAGYSVNHYYVMFNRGVGHIVVAVILLTITV
jgi:hypothetical protein